MTCWDLNLEAAQVAITQAVNRRAGLFLHHRRHVVLGPEVLHSGGVGEQVANLDVA